MSTTPAENDSILARIKASRSDSELIQEPTEAVSDEEPAEEAETEVAEEPAEEVSSEEAEDVLSEGAHDDGGEDLYVEIDGREISLKEIKEWEQGNLRQSDYTRKTTEASEDRKALKAEREEFDGKRADFNQQLSVIEAMIEEDTLTEEQATEMREYEPEAYIKHIEKQAARKKILSESKASSPSPSMNVEEERSKLWSANPTWINEGKTTDAFTRDTALMNDYAAEAGYTSEELAGFTAKNLLTILDAARFRASAKKKDTTAKKVRKAPVTTRPRGETGGNRSAIDEAKKAFKANPTDANAVALRKARRKQN